MTAPLSDPPIRTSLLLALTTQSALLTELFTALPSAVGDITGLYGSLVASATQLDSLARDAEAHQLAWMRLQAQKREVQDLEARVRGLVRELETGRVGLEAMVDEGRRIKEGIDASEKGEWLFMRLKLWLRVSCACTYTSRPCERSRTPRTRARLGSYHQRAGQLPPRPRRPRTGNPMAQRDEYAPGPALPARGQHEWYRRRWCGRRR